ncbi:hypothetical protein J2X72_004576 [Phyllobacterium sp. 1468]|uniref:hypothetical protein n=1 Tax=Phyllobacterium sp. 1468 TaxID=2817759 RepID=UPI002861438D|nr:hypothetical protein [Phyllobacterium sp. 1468]MDR6635762.1 hypothetical protein [Phyllobacterium sp. 1468]
MPKALGVIRRRFVLAGPRTAPHRPLRQRRGGNPYFQVYLYHWLRDGQLPYATMAVNVIHADALILKCQHWLAENYECADLLTEVARISGLPKRTFHR